MNSQDDGKDDGQALSSEEGEKAKQVVGVMAHVDGDCERAEAEHYKTAMNHPYIQYIQGLNMTACYKEMLLAGVPEIEKYVPSPVVYHQLRIDFAAKYPKAIAEFKKIKPSDCVIS